MQGSLRHEFKHEINLADQLALRARLRLLMKPDEHGTEYRIRSLYFDNFCDKALKEKLDGLENREKFRIRLYNGDDTFIRLEKKEKLHGLCRKTSAVIAREECEKLLSGDKSWMKGRGPLFEELSAKMDTQMLRPKTIVDYTREAFVYPAGNVRVTFDSGIRTGILKRGLLDDDLLTVSSSQIRILEVKFDRFLPEHIQDALQLESRPAAAFSKYAACRIFG